MARNIKKTVLFGGKKSAKSGTAIEEKPEPQPKKKLRKRLTVAAAAIVILAGLYCLAVFSNIPFIKQWRDIYIETAMDTLSHKWLATLIIPASVIDGVMANKDSIIADQQGLQSSWNVPPKASSAPLPSQDTVEVNPEDAFFEKYSELDKDSFRNYMKQNPELLTNGYDHLLINESGLTEKGTSIKTVQGDQVLVVDAENGIIIVKLTGKGFVGKMALIKDPAQVKIGVSKAIGSYGQTVEQIATRNNAVLAINASGFADDEGTGSGGVVVGLLIANGKKYSNPVTGTFLNIGFGTDDRLYIGVSTAKMTYRDAVEFVPAMIVNGKNVTKSGTMGFGIQPRSSIGQTEDGTVLLMTVDGRKPGYSIGCSVPVCADIMVKYGAVQAANLDGGSSTIMVYRGEIITDPSAVSDQGRYVPDAFIVSYAEGATNKPDNTSK